MQRQELAKGQTQTPLLLWQYRVWDCHFSPEKRQGPACFPSPLSALVILLPGFGQG